MYILKLAFYSSGMIHALFTSQILIFYFLLVVGLYILIGQNLIKAKDLSIRKKIMVGTWTPPSQGIIHCRFSPRVDKILNLIQQLPKQNRPTLTHFVIKAIGNVLTNSPDLNGKLVFGKFVPFKTADVSCIVDIDNGNDGGIINVEDVGNKGVIQIAEFIKIKAKIIKQNKGDKDHKNRTGLLKYFPPFFVTIIVQISQFLYHYLSVTIKPMSLKRDQFGGACLTSIGSIGFQDATAPNPGFMGVSFLVSLNKAHQAPVIENSQLKIGRIANINFAVDHRYIDGGKCKSLIPSFLDIFKNPQKYLKATKNNDEIKQFNKIE